MLVLFHDYTSPGSAIAVARLQRLADEGLPVSFEGFDAHMVDTHLPVTLDALADLDDATQDAAAEGVAMNRPSVLPPTARAHTLGDYAEASGLGASWRLTCYRTFWDEGVDLADPRVLEDLAHRAGLDREEARGVLSDPGAVLAVRRRSAARRGEGIGGVPTIRVHGTLIPGLITEADLRALL